MLNRAEQGWRVLTLSLPGFSVVLPNIWKIETRCFHGYSLNVLCGHKQWIRCSGRFSGLLAVRGWTLWGRHNALMCLALAWLTWCMNAGLVNYMNASCRPHGVDTPIILMPYRRVTHHDDNKFMLVFSNMLSWKGYQIPFSKIKIVKKKRAKEEKMYT